MKKILLSLLAVGAIFTANAQMAEGAQARVYAYDLKINSETKEVTFKTNTVATTAKVIIDGITEEVTATSNDGKNWTATIEPSAAYTAGTEYNWSVEVSAPAVTSFTCISDHTTPNFLFNRAYAVAVDNSPESDYFGRVYVANAKGTSGTNVTTDPNGTVSRSNPAGLYAYKADLTIIKNGNLDYFSPDLIGFNNDVDDIAALDAEGGNSPRRLAIAEDGRIFMSMWNHAISGPCYINPANLNSNTMVFTGGTRPKKDGGYYTKDGNTYIGGAISGIAVCGSGDETTLYTIDQTSTYKNNDPSVNYYVNAIQCYEIGTNNTWNTAPSFKVSGDFTSAKLYSQYNSIDMVSTGYWIAQKPLTLNNTYTTLFYYSTVNKAIEFNARTHDLTKELTHTNTSSGGLAVNEDLGLVAYTEYNSSNNSRERSIARILNYSINDDKSISIDDVVDYKLLKQGDRTNELAFDYAGNLYAVSSYNTNYECMAVYAIPTDNNTRVTPAKKSSTISFTQNEIDIATGLDNIAVDVNAPVEYYNMQGVKVENPSNGIFIKKQGNKTTKVVL